MKMGQRLTNLSYNYSVRNPKRPKWIGEATYNELLKRRKEATFLEKSEMAKKNRRGGSLSNPIEPSHYQGSISAAQHAKKMVLNNIT